MSDIQELFDRNPLTFTKAGGEVQKIIEYLRNARQAHLGGEKSAGNLKPKPEKKTLNLKDLGL